MALFYTISRNTESQEEEKREFATEKEARLNASIDTNNKNFRLYIVEPDKGTDEITYLGRLPSMIDYDFEYYELNCIDNTNKKIIYEFDNQQQAREYINTLNSNTKFYHYTLNRIKVSEPNQQPTVELVYLIPGNYDVEYYSLRGMDEFGDETQIIGFRTFEELQEYTLVPSKKYIQYSFFRVLSIRENGRIIDHRELILQKSNLPQKKRRKLILLFHKRR